MTSSAPWLWTFVAAELLFVIARARDIKVAAKPNVQRTARERQRVARGLRRALLWDAILFVPVSSLLIVLLAPLLLLKFDPRVPTYTLYSLLGIVSYGFPFAAVRAFVRRAALATLKEFASISIAPDANDDEL